MDADRAVQGRRVVVRVPPAAREHIRDARGILVAPCPPGMGFAPGTAWYVRVEPHMEMVPLGLQFLDEEGDPAAPVAGWAPVPTGPPWPGTEPAAPGERLQPPWSRAVPAGRVTDLDEAAVDLLGVETLRWSAADPPSRPLPADRAAAETPAIRRLRTRADRAAARVVDARSDLERAQAELEDLRRQVSAKEDELPDLAARLSVRERELRDAEEFLNAALEGRRVNRRRAAEAAAAAPVEAEAAPPPPTRHLDL